MHQQFRPHESGEPARLEASSAQSLSQSSGTKQEVTRQSTTINGRLIVGKRGSLIITLDRNLLGFDTQDVRLSSRDRRAMCRFIPRREAHITLSGFNPELQASLHDPIRSERLERLLKQLNGEKGIEVTFDPASPLRRIERVYRGSYADGKGFEEYREALIREVSCEKIEQIITTIGEFLGAPLPLPYLFVTLYSSGSGHNIAVPTREALEALNPSDLPVEEIARAKVSGTDQAEKISAFVSMVDRMRERRCPEINGIKILPSAQIGEIVLAALVALDPIEKLTKAIEQPAVATALHKILALRCIPCPQKHGLEKSALEHTLHVVAEASKLCIERNLTLESKKAVMLAALLQDLGRGGAWHHTV